MSTEWIVCYRILQLCVEIVPWDCYYIPKSFFAQFLHSACYPAAEVISNTKQQRNSENT